MVQNDTEMCIFHPTELQQILLNITNKIRLCVVGKGLIHYHIRHL